MTNKRPIWDRIERTIKREFNVHSKEVWDAVTEARCGPGTFARIAGEFPNEKIFWDTEPVEWVCGGQKSALHFYGKPLIMDVFYAEGTLAFNGTKGPLVISSIPFSTL